jgi:hypothetical protein
MRYIYIYVKLLIDFESYVATSCFTFINLLGDTSVHINASSNDL